MNNIFQSITDSVTTTAANVKYFTEHRLGDARPDSNRLIIDDIKDAYVVPMGNIYEAIYSVITGNDKYKLSGDQYTSWLVDSIADETNQFYCQNVKSNTLKNITKKLNTRIIDNLKLNGKNVDAIPYKFVINGSEYKYIVDRNTVKEISQALLLCDNVCLRLYSPEVSTIKSIVVKPYQYLEYNGSFFFPYCSNGKWYVEQRTHIDGALHIDTLIWHAGKLKGESSIMIETSSAMVYKYSTDIELVSQGALDLILMYSQFWGTVDKEIILAVLQLFVDQGYVNNCEALHLREYLVPVSNPDTDMVGEEAKPLFEVVQPNLRSTDLRELRSFIKDEIIEVLGLDKAAIGFNDDISTATQTKVMNSQTVDTINDIKSSIETAINYFFTAITGVSSKIEIERYRINDQSTIIQDNQIALASRQMDIKEAVFREFPTKSQEENEEHYIRILLRNDLRLMPDEVELAKKYNLWDESMVPDPIEDIDGPVL